jgi:energy-coupling factor transporter transmembrane protein EcfT
MTFSLMFFLTSIVIGLISMIFFFWIVYYLTKHDESVDFLGLRNNFYKYLKMYKEISAQESGAVGIPYYGCYISIVSAGLLFCASIISKILSLNG